MKIAIITSRFNEAIVDALLQGALHALEQSKMDLQTQVQTIEAPGAFEIPLIAKKCAETKKFDGIIALGCVIKGETAHFEYISHACAEGILNVSLEFGLPVSFGVITTYDRDQAERRSVKASSIDQNKGYEAAKACMDTLKSIQSLT